MGILVFSLGIIVIIEIGLNFVTIEKAEADYMGDHKFYHKKTSETMSKEEKDNLYMLRSWY
jgi:hypothetical protein